MKSRKSVKQSEIITDQPKTFKNTNIVGIKSVITQHPKTSCKLSKTIGKGGKVGSNSSLYSDTVKPLNSGHLRVLKNLSIVKWRPLLRRSLTKIVIFGTKHFVCYSKHVRHLGFPLLGGFPVEKEVNIF